MTKLTLLTMFVFFSTLSFSQEIKSIDVHGTVQWFDTTKGIGYIQTEEGNEIFVNYDNLPKKNGRFITLQPNQKVIFDISEESGYPEAININIKNNYAK